MFLEYLLKSIGGAIQEARQAIDKSAADFFLTDFREEDGKLRPETKSVVVKNHGLEQNYDVPVAGLKHHNVLHLSQVDIKLKARLTETEDKKLIVDLMPLKEDDEDQKITEIHLVFNSSDSSEGVSRIKDKMVNSM
jgi:hypothetical protein